MSGDKLSKLRELAKDLPDDLVADWRWTNHFELTGASGKRYWWLIANNEEDWSDALESGRRMGLVLDIVAEVSRHLPREDPLAKLREIASELPPDQLECARDSQGNLRLNVACDGGLFWLDDLERENYQEQWELVLRIAAEVSRLKAEGVL